jgi:DNA mismatch endonuclease, patch repair protein
MARQIPSHIRSKMMARIRGFDTKPELVVRQMLHRLGYRFRLHRRDLPGCPDIVLPRHHAVIFVNGCFWHQHENCCLAKLPKSRTDYWTPKLNGNKARDQRNHTSLRHGGWRLLVIWECQLDNPSRLRGRLQRFLLQPVTNQSRRTNRFRAAGPFRTAPVPAS